METVFYMSIVVLVGSMLIILLRRPKQKKDWVPEHSVPAQAAIEGDTITLKNIVHATYTTPYKCSVRHRSKIFNIKDVESLWLLIEIFPMQAWPIKFNLAHSFLTFGFKDGTFVSISVAGRRQLGERVTLSRILPHKNEIVYKVINEADTVFARSSKSRNELRLYKLRAAQHNVQRVLMSMLREINALHGKPSWFDTFTRNCTTDMVGHLRNGGLEIPLWHPSYIFTTGIDKLFYRFGVLDTNLQFTEAVVHHNITPIVQELGKDAELSKKIRKNL